MHAKCYSFFVPKKQVLRVKTENKNDTKQAVAKLYRCTPKSTWLGEKQQQ